MMHSMTHAHTHRQWDFSRAWVQAFAIQAVSFAVSLLSDISYRHVYACRNTSQTEETEADKGKSHQLPGGKSVKASRAAGMKCKGS